MRADMAQVIVERPRVNRGPRTGFERYHNRFGDDPPRRDRMAGKWDGGSKHFNEHLGPLRRYLDKQVGRPWDKVHSEICAHLRRDSVVQDHVRDHLDDYVASTVVVIDDELHAVSPGRRPTPLAARWGPKWYVCPRTGLLRRVERDGQKVARHKERAARKPAKELAVRVSPRQECRKVNGVWHLVTFRRLPDPPAVVNGFDVLFRQDVRRITMSELKQRYGAAVFAVEARPLGRRELRNYPVPVEWWA